MAVTFQGIFMPHDVIYTEIMYHLDGVDEIMFRCALGNRPFTFDERVYVYVDDTTMSIRINNPEYSVDAWIINAMQEDDMDAIDLLMEHKYDHMTRDVSCVFAYCASDVMITQYVDCLPGINQLLVSAGRITLHNQLFGDVNSNKLFIKHRNSNRLIANMSKYPLTPHQIVEITRWGGFNLMYNCVNHHSRECIQNAIDLVVNAGRPLSHNELEAVSMLC